MFGEATVAATVVHYVNEILASVENLDTTACDHAAFLDHAEGWSQMKGFALMFHLDPRSPSSRDQLLRLRTLLDVPVLPAAGTSPADGCGAALREAHRPSVPPTRSTPSTRATPPEPAAGKPVSPPAQREPQ